MALSPNERFAEQKVNIPVPRKDETFPPDVINYRNKPLTYLGQSNYSDLVDSPAEVQCVYCDIKGNLYEASLVNEELDARLIKIRTRQKVK